ncbi:hypothetical protein Ancab_037595 [Ancistrocladus abbreviatus]
MARSGRHPISRKHVATRRIYRPTRELSLEKEPHRAVIEKGFARTSLSLFFTNFPEDWSTFSMWKRATTPALSEFQSLSRRTQTQRDAQIKQENTKGQPHKSYAEALRGGTQIGETTSENGGS